jgi:hypothetical protein
MQATQNIVVRTRVVVLHKTLMYADASQPTLVVTLQEKAAVVSEHPWYHQQNALKLCL